MCAIRKEQVLSNIISVLGSLMAFKRAVINESRRTWSKWKNTAVKHSSAPPECVMQKTDSLKTHCISRLIYLLNEFPAEFIQRKTGGYEVATRHAPHAQATPIRLIDRSPVPNGTLQSTYNSCHVCVSVQPTRCRVSHLQWIYRLDALVTVLTVKATKKCGLIGRL